MRTGKLDPLGHFKHKNVIINGAMDIAQRGTSFAAVADSAFTLDRWRWLQSLGTGVVTITQDTTVPTAAQFGGQLDYSLKIDCTTAEGAVAAAEYALLRYTVEGYDFRQLAGQTATLSFWVQAVKTGIYCVSFNSSGSDRSYVAEYTINSANTWEKKIITLTFNYSGGTWNYTNAVGVRINFALACGSTYQTTANAWQTGNYNATSNQVNGLDNTNNNFYITGVQLEVGSAASTFDFEPINVTLEKCQRYFEKSYDLGSPPGTADAVGVWAFVDPTTQSYFHISYKVRKRATAPTVTFYSYVTGTAGKYRDVTSGADFDMNGAQESSESGFDAYPTSHGAADELIFIHWTSSSEI